MTGVSEFCRRRALELYPRLALAVPPKPIGRAREYPLRVGDPPYCVANYWWSAHMREHKVRRTGDAAHVVGPLVGMGSCLFPLVADGDRMYFDPSIPAQHGDLVLIQCRLGSPPVGELMFLCKMLVEFADEYWLAFNEGMFQLAETKILGVAVCDPRLDAARRQVINSAESDACQST